MTALRKRLGEFEPGPSTHVRVPAPSRAIDPSAPTLPVYLDERRKHYKERDARRARVTGEQRNKWREMIDRHRNERTDILRGSWRGKRDLLNAARSVLAARQAQEKAALRERQQRERVALRRDMGPFRSYEDWLARRDREQADRWRHRERRPATIAGATFEQPLPRDIRSFAAVLDGARVHYHLAGSRRPSFTDHGKTIDVYDSRSRESVLAALQLSAQKWGTISVRGNREFMRACVELAAERGFKIANPELQEAIAAEGERLRRPRREGAAGRERGADNRRTRTPAEIYRHHLASISRASEDQRIHPSRIDAVIAVHMRLAGHRRDEIVLAIKEVAGAERPGEKRDWDAYAKRTAAVAFGIPGDHLAERLRRQGDRLPPLERHRDEPEPSRR
jgi:hypothetical protein